jgi:hypothetical protein
VELGKDVVDVVLDRFLAEAEPPGDVLITKALGDQIVSPSSVVREVRQLSTAL